MNVWYASYGSNVMLERFLAYIVGGKVPNSSAPERGCRDRSLPKEVARIDIPYPLYFAKERSKWGEGGVAFIGTERSKMEKTIGRMYLISEEQFFDVVSQENDGMDVAFSLKEVEHKGFLDIHSGWYNRIIFLGRKNGAPIFTFSSSTPVNYTTCRKPSKAYLSVIANGLTELGLSKEGVVEYLISKKGIEGEFSKQTLQEYLEGRISNSNSSV